MFFPVDYLTVRGVNMQYYVVIFNALASNNTESCIYFYITFILYLFSGATTYHLLIYLLTIQHKFPDCQSTAAVTAASYT